jgi:hypothetical protein
MLAPSHDDPEWGWGRPYSRRRLWRNRGLIGAVWVAAFLGVSLQAFDLLRALLK